MEVENVETATVQNVEGDSSTSDEIELMEEGTSDSNKSSEDEGEKTGDMSKNEVVPDPLSFTWVRNLLCNI